MVLPRHDDTGKVFDDRCNAAVIRCNNDFSDGSRFLSLFDHVLDERLSRNGMQGLPWKP
jgi:hypothetical protein